MKSGTRKEEITAKERKGKEGKKRPKSKGEARKKGKTPRQEEE